MTIRDQLNSLLDQMGQWRHFPAYRLEPHADVFLAPFIPIILEAKCDCPIRHEVIPEFPLRLGTLFPESRASSNKSVKVDYLAASTDGARVFLVELKTDMASFRSGQDNYLQVAESKPWSDLLQGVLHICGATDGEHFPKYRHLLAALDRLGWLQMPDEALDHKPRVGRRWLGDVTIGEDCRKIRPEIVYVQPAQGGTGTRIDFAEVSRVLREQGGELGNLFADHLEQWTTPAGKQQPGWRDS